MQINFYNKTAFSGIKSTEGGTEYVYKEGGPEALSRLNDAKEQFADSKWKLLIGKDGYALQAPNNKSYTGPFSVKRRIISGAAKEETSKLIIRMDKNNRVKYSTFVPDKVTLLKWYRMIQKSKGLEKILNILTVLEKRF